MPCQHMSSPLYTEAGWDEFRSHPDLYVLVRFLLVLVAPLSYERCVSFATTLLLKFEKNNEAKFRNSCLQGGRDDISAQTFVAAMAY
jgi:hypothetical protein